MNRKRLGIPLIGGKKWMGGISYTELLLKALQTIPPEQRPECIVVMDAASRENWPLYTPLAGFFSRCVFLVSPETTDEQKSDIAREVGLAVEFAAAADLFEHIDVYFPAIFSAIPGGKAISWIPDFQHCFWPEFFAPGERQDRDENMAKVLEQADMLVFSSQSVQADFQRYYPATDIPTAVLPFYSLPEPGWYAGDSAATAAKYDLPERYFICCNQFWLHKNHKLLGDALALVKERHGVEVPLVCTGSTTEYRAPEYAELLRQYWISRGIAQQVTVLGMIPRADQIQLIRRSLAVVQPSLSEGWSTVVEDARVLGKITFLSSLPVHREQQPAGAAFFDPWNAAELAELIYEGWRQYSPGPDPAAEARARESIPELVREFAEKFLAVTETVLALPSRLRATTCQPSPPVSSMSDIPTQLQEWGRDLLERFGLLAQLLARKIPATTPVTVWRGGIGPLHLALQSLGNPVLAVGNQPVEHSFLDLLTQNSVPFLPSLPEGAELAVVADAADWEMVASRHPQRIALTCPTAERADWLQRLTQAGYGNQVEQMGGDWTAIAGAMEPWATEQMPLAPSLIADQCASQAYRNLREARDDLRTALTESEADRAARLEIMQRLERWLHDSEAHRAAQGELIERLLRENGEMKEKLNFVNAHLLVRVAKKLGVISRKRIE